jgi:ubiquinone/menaquinone biosynthesis C-methylase UbiE
MSESTRSDTYYITDTDETIGRLIRASEIRAQHVHDGLRRTDLGFGDKVMDVGCGPLGGLLQLSDQVGPQGTVVGVDVDERSLRRARAILDKAGRENVRLVHANINAEPCDELRGLGPFDAAYCRLFLLHQQDPAATLRRMAALLRPGGHIVAHELLLDGPLPPSEPAVPEIEQVLRWAREIGLKRGASADVARQFHAVCAQAGLREMSQRLFGSVATEDAPQTIRIWRDSLLAIRPALLQHAVASEEEITTVLHRLAEAEEWAFEALLAGLYVELVAQAPASP